MAILPGSLLDHNSASGDSWASVLFMASLLGRNSACGESIIPLLVKALVCQGSTGPIN